MKHGLFTPDGSSSLFSLLTAKIEGSFGLELTPAAIAELIMQGSVYQAKRRIKDPGFVPQSAAGEIEIFYPELPVLPFLLDPGRIAYEDEDLLLVDKPGGVNAAPSPFSDIDCLTHGVQSYLDSPAGQARESAGYRVSAVHRLDRDTRGLMFFAKNKSAELLLHRMFREQRVRRMYLARSPAETGLDKPKVQLHRVRDILEWRGKSQEAATTIAWKARAGNHAEGAQDEWMVVPHTGRPHQIRKHFAKYIAPICGDRVYAPELYDRGSHMALVCVAYRCKHPITERPLHVSLDCTRVFASH